VKIIFVHLLVNDNQLSTPFLPSIAAGNFTASQLLKLTGGERRKKERKKERKVLLN
jgi:hypothetical protein